MAATENVSLTQNHDRRERDPEALPSVVIVGGGFGGLRAARALAPTRHLAAGIYRVGPHAPVHVTLIDRKNHHLFQPLLYQVATAALSPADISAPIRHVLRRQKNAEVLLAEVTGVDVARQEVHVHDLATGTYDRAVPYDYLILATGASQSYFGHDEWAEYAMSLKSVEDATAIRRKLLLAFEAAEQEMGLDPDEARALLTFVIVGAGPTGVEMAGEIAEVARKSLLADFRHIDPATARILLVEAAPRILAAYPESLAGRAAAKLRRMGVEVRTGSKVEQVDAEGVVIDGERIPARTVVWAAGVQASPAGAWLGAETDRAGRVVVRDDLSVPGHPEIFVIGDTAHAMWQGQPLPGVAPVALQQGAYVAKVIRGRLAGRTAIKPFAYFDKGTLSTVGRLYAIADIRGLRLFGFFAWIIWVVVHIFFLIGFRNRVVVMFQWAWAYLTYQRGARLITNGGRQPAREREEARELVG